MTHLTYMTYMTLMNYSEKRYKPKISLGQPGNTLMTLIAICLIMYVGLAFMKAIWYFRFSKEEALAFFNKDVVGLFTLPADPDKLLSRPWTIITHMFVHDNFWKILSNMLWLWCFGYIMQDNTGSKRIIPVFVYGALGGAIAFILAYNLLPTLHAQMPFANAIGASAGVMAIAIATTLLAPGYRIFPMIGGGIPLWVLTAFYIISDLATVPISDTGNLIAHIAGAVTGFLFIFFLRMGFDWSKWMNNFFDWVNDLFNPDKPKKGKNTKDELFYRSSATPYTKTPNLTQQRVDEILDKINQEGYDFLTEEEKELLKRAGEEKL
jgi:membrane associated rhomboid family serine protease